MIKYIETLIKVVTFLVVIFFFYHLLKDVASYLTKVNINQENLEKAVNENNDLKISLNKSKAFYQENQKIIESTRIVESDLILLRDLIFKNIVDKKIGFFSMKESSFERDTKIINIYKIKGILSLDITSLFTLEDMKNLLNNEINKSIVLLNSMNKDRFEIIPTFIQLNGNEYSFELSILKKHSLS